MSLLLLFFSSFWVGLSGAMMPGPLLTVNVAEATRRGFLAGPILVGGHAIAELGVVFALWFGLSQLLNAERIANAIGLIGGLALILMGAMMLYDVFRRRISFDPAAPVSGSGILVGKGITASLSNPYWFVWWATVGSAFLTKSLIHGIAGPIVFYFGHIMSDLAWYSLVSFLIGLGKKVIAGKPFYVIITVCALFLLYLGGAFIIDAIT